MRGLCRTSLLCMGLGACLFRGGSSDDPADSDPEMDDSGVRDAPTSDAFAPAEPSDARPFDAEVLPDIDSGSAIDAAPPPDASATPLDASATPFDGGPPPTNPMTFFVTSTGSGANGGNLGGLAGADATCADLATAVGAGDRTWRAYLSTGATGPGPIVNARDRIGNGPWQNALGIVIAANLVELHTVGIAASDAVDETGAPVPLQEHDILTGSAADGTLDGDFNTCATWTDGTDAYQRTVGHSDVPSGESWNSQHTGACDEASIVAHAGSGRVYCFSVEL